MSEVVVIVRYNAPLQPMDRGQFEDPIEDFLRRADAGEITGGGSQLKEDGIAYAETEFALTSRAHIPALITELENLGVPKGTLLLDGDEQTAFGRNEGLAIHLNGTDLPAEIYAQSDVNFVVDEIVGLIAPEGRFLTHWQGKRETSLYFYGPSFDAMRTATAAFLATYPLCQRCRVEQVA